MLLKRTNHTFGCNGYIRLRLNPSQLDVSPGLTDGVRLLAICYLLLRLWQRYFDIKTRNYSFYVTVDNNLLFIEGDRSNCSAV